MAEAAAVIAEADEAAVLAASAAYRASSEERAAAEVAPTPPPTSSPTPPTPPPPLPLPPRPPRHPLLFPLQAISRSLSSSTHCRRLSNAKSLCPCSEPCTRCARASVQSSSRPVRASPRLTAAGEAAAAIVVAPSLPSRLCSTISSLRARCWRRWASFGATSRFRSRWAKPSSLSTPAAKRSAPSKHSSSSSSSSYKCSSRTDRQREEVKPPHRPRSSRLRSQPSSPRRRLPNRHPAQRPSRPHGCTAYRWTRGCR